METVLRLKKELDGKLTTNMNISDAKKTDSTASPIPGNADRCAWGGALFTVPLQHDLTPDSEISFMTHTQLGVANDTFPIVLGILEYNFDYYDSERQIWRSQTSWIGDTGPIWQTTGDVGGKTLQQGGRHTYKLKNLVQYKKEAAGTDIHGNTIYNEIGLPAKEFHALYDAFNDAYMGAQIPNPKKPGEMMDPWVNVGTVEDIVNSESQGTHILKWTVTAEEAWKYAGKEIEHYVAYYKNGTPELKAIIRLVGKVAPVAKEYNVLPADYISNFWNAEKTATRYNVAVGAFDTDSIPAHCVFVNEINYSFETWRKDDEAVKKEGAVEGLIRLAPYITKVDYFFCGTKGHDIKAPKIDGKDVEFKILKDTVLTARVKGAAAYDTIAVINNHPDELLNTITLNKESDLAKALLNTKQLYVNIGAKGYACGDPNKVVKITFNGQDHFRADYVRPINISNIAADKYIDGVSYGEKGSYICVEDLIAPSDWRSELDSKKWISGEYGKNRQFSNYPFFWGFYGPFYVDVDLANAKCDLNGRVAAIPAYLQLARLTYDQMKDVITTEAEYKKLKKSEHDYMS